MNRKKKFIAGIAALTILIVLIITYNYIYQDHRDIASEKVAFTLPPEALKTALSDKVSAQKYIDQVIQTQGTISAVEQNTVFIEEIAQVNFAQNFAGLAEDQHIIIKGRCVGYDDLLEIVKIDQAIIINN